MAEDKELVILPYYRDKEALLKDIQEHDLKELKAACREHKKPINVYWADLIKKSTEAYSVFYHNKLLMCAGVSKSPLAGFGVIWLMSTKHVKEFPKAYYKSCIKLKERALKLYPMGIFTITAANYEEALSINERVGFKTLGSIMVGNKEHYLCLLKGEQYAESDDKLVEQLRS